MDPFPRGAGLRLPPGEGGVPAAAGGEAGGGRQEEPRRRQGGHRRLRRRQADQGEENFISKNAAVFLPK